MKTIIIIGAGFSGVMTAVNLIKFSEQPLKIYLADSRKERAKGLAYSTNNDLHLLNVPAGKMGAFHDDIENFYKWIKEHYSQFKADDFVPRRIYGEYLDSIFSEYKKKALSKNIQLNEINDKAIDITIINNRYQVAFKYHEMIIADKVILATGNFPPRNISVTTPEFYKSESYFQNPWGEKVFEKLTDNNILLIGSGLTMVDLVLSLFQRNYHGKVYVISPHGYIPRVHEKTQDYPYFFDENNLPETVKHAFKIIKNEIKKAEKQGISWHSVVDSIRPFTQKIWLNFSTEEKNKFMKYLRHRWGVLRHRMAPQVSEIFNSLLKNKQIEIFAGKIISFDESENNIKVVFKNRKSNNIQEIRVEKVINCTGPESDITRIDDQLIKNLLEKKLIKPDSIKLGIDASPTGNILNENNEVEKNFFTIGNNLKGVLWESTAVPELRQQSYILALELLKD